MLKKAFRLPAKTSFTNAHTIHTDYASIKYQKNDLDLTRFGFVVSKRISKSAVVRNSIKRRIRACIEQSLSTIRPGYDILFIIKKSLGQTEKINCQSLLSALNKKLL